MVPLEKRRQLKLLVFRQKNTFIDFRDSMDQKENII